HFDQSMEPVLELPKALEEKADSPGDHGSQDPTFLKGGNGAAVQGQPSPCGEEPPCQQLSFRQETLDQQVLEYMEVALFLSPEEQQRRWLAILTTFLKACEQSDGSINFPNIQLLASETSSFLVKEIKKKMNGNSVEDARLLVWQFLQWKGELDSDGYLLLKSIYSLSLYTSVRERLKEFKDVYFQQHSPCGLSYCWQNGGLCLKQETCFILWASMLQE
ncbi:WD repeat- and FYVE domain-containing protein 4-like, partial [Pseudonaja textilis]|uniref:WD repeat- and FYVE domain-containing protein 4-like n=1 Tax=Pseudonaja textilis TaxID=8673 RepID=UPI000EA8AE8D